MESPWDVENILAFNFLCCPECEFKSKEQNVFEEHALGNHPESKRFFMRQEDTSLSSKTSFPPGINVTVLKSDNNAYEEDSKEMLNVKLEVFDNDIDKDFEDHEEESKSSITWQCQQCSSSFDSRLDFTDHLKTAHAKVDIIDPREVLEIDEQTLKCPCCFREIRTSEFSKHMRMVHAGGSEGKKKFNTTISTCKLCGKKFGNKGAYIHHCKSIHKSLPPELADLPKIPCPECKADFVSTRDLSKHLAGVHRIKPTRPSGPTEETEEKTAWPCDECSKIFPNEKKLRAHQNNHKFVVCETCGKSYSIPSMKFHEKTCNIDKSIKRFQCDHCPYKTHARTQLLAHKRLNHLNFDFKPEGVTYDQDGLLICPACPRKMERSRYVGHYKTTHGTFPPGYPVDKLVKCDKCGIDFPSNRNLGRHMRLCHPEAMGLTKKAKPRLPCNICGREITKAGMAKHIESVHGDKSDKKYSCDKCDFKSHCIKYLRAHEYYGHRKKEGHF